MRRRIIRIDGEKCNDCGLSAAACHEGAIGIIDARQGCCGKTIVMVLAAGSASIQ